MGRPRNFAKDEHREKIAEVVRTSRSTHYTDGYLDGAADGYQAGYHDGYAEGWQDGSQDPPCQIEGTSQ